MHTEERTFIAVKPDAVQRGLIGEIVKRFETKGYKVIGLKMIRVSDEQAKAHYAEHEGKPFYPRLIRYIQSGPIVAMVIQGYGVVAGARHMMGCTDPNKADMGTIRADFAQVMEYNVVHGSDSPESAEREIAIYFNENELFPEGKCMSELVIESLDAD
ncbi:nucleoside-diphosphate kinase [bacterium]|nr:nucleoside-diphosphate kinase [bacterium]MBR6723139.1 nucleoside-diphosphate kinase [bacterium]